MKHLPLGQMALGLVLAATSAVAAVDPALLSLAPPDTKAFIGIQVDQAQTSTFGQYVLSQVDPNNGMDKFVTLTGFDPKRDLKQILIASNGKSSGQGSALILGRGVFQPDKLTAAATLGGATKVTYSGIDLLTSKSTNQGVQTLAFLDSSTVLIGDIAGLKAAIDRYRSSTPYQGALAQRATEVSSQYQAWFVTAAVDEMTANFGGAGAGGGLPANALQSVLQAAGGLKLSADAVTFALEAVTRTDKDAQSLVDVVKFLASMVQMNRNNDANSARAATLVDSASITANGSLMRVSLAIPEKDIEQMIGQARSTRKQ